MNSSLTILLAAMPRIVTWCQRSNTTQRAPANKLPIAHRLNVCRYYSIVNYHLCDSYDINKQYCHDRKKNDVCNTLAVYPPES
jgi:hypothetical protein